MLGLGVGSEVLHRHASGDAQLGRELAALVGEIAWPDFLA
jgi:hypothetical protein